MTTIDQRSAAEQAELAPALDPNATPLDCAQCGRNCKHIPTTAGGGTAGGNKGEKWEETLRSRLRCPSCGQKPHRKEGRAHQMLACLMAQVGNQEGLTVLPQPTAEIMQKAADFMRSGKYKEAPTERQMSIIIRRQMGETISDEEYNRVGRGSRTTSVEVPRVTPGEAPTNANFEPADPIELPSMVVEAAQNAMKRKRTDEEKAADRAAREQVAANKKAEVEAEKVRKAAERTAAAEQRLREQAEKAEAKAQAARDKLANAATPSSTTPAAPTGRKETKKEREARLMEAAEREGGRPVVTMTPIEEAATAGTITEPDYDPLAGVGQPFDEDDEDDEEPLTPAQLAALGKLN